MLFESLFYNLHTSQDQIIAMLWLVLLYIFYKVISKLLATQLFALLYCETRTRLGRLLGARAMQDPPLPAREAEACGKARISIKNLPPKAVPAASADEHQESNGTE